MNGDYLEEAENKMRIRQIWEYLNLSSITSS